MKLVAALAFLGFLVVIIAAMLAAIAVRTERQSTPLVRAEWTQPDDRLFAVCPSVPRVKIRQQGRSA